MRHLLSHTIKVPRLNLNKNALTVIRKWFGIASLLNARNERKNVKVQVGSIQNFGILFEKTFIAKTKKLIKKTRKQKTF